MAQSRFRGAEPKEGQDSQVPQDWGPFLPLLEGLARRYIWWKDPRKVARDQPLRVLAQVMEMGTWEDVRRVEKTLPPESLAKVLWEGEPGWFQPRSWAFWHYRLGLTPTSEEPSPPPARRFS